jgi:hypothetical protein
MPKPMMMFKSVINEVENCFYFDQACSTEVAKLALLDAIKWLGQIEDAAKAVAAKPEEAQAPPEVSEQKAE